MTDDYNYKVYKGSLNLKIVADCINDISDADDVTLKVKKPDGSSVTWGATVEDLQYAIYYTQEGDLDQTGIYSVQPKIDTTDGLFYGNTDHFMVYDEFD